jgi:hypothetical protein
MKYFIFTFFLSSVALEIGCASHLRPNTDLSTKNIIAYEVPQRLQIGPTCGLYALGMVMDYWHAKNSNTPTVLVSDDDLNGKGRQFNFEPTSNERILNYVKDAGFSKAGEMYDARLLAKAAAHFGYHATYYPHVTLQEIYKALDQHHPMIVAFDVSPPDGEIGFLRGEGAHYAVLESYFDDRQTRYFVAKHGWGKRVKYIWKADQLLASMNNLQYTSYYSSSEPPKHLKLSIYRGNRSLRNISKTLQDKAIEIIPVGEIAVGGSEVY